MDKYKKIWLASPHMSEQGYEQEFIQEAFKSNWLAPLGPNIDNFEKEVATRVGSKHAVALTSGTSAIHLALRALHVGVGDIVLCQTLTFSASANPIIYEGATPVFIDSHYETWNMDPYLLEEALKKYKNKVKAVIVVHLFGFPADMTAIMSICNKYGVAVIEDAAESLGSYYKEQHTGTFGKYGVFSFNGNKIITTTGGGMLVSDDEERINKVRFWATQARDQARHYQHSELGFNYRMSNVLAGIGRGQLKVLNERVAKKKYIHDYYLKKLGHLQGLSFMPENEWSNPNYWLSVITLRDAVRPLTVMETLETENIETRPVWKPMHLQPFFKEYDYLGGRVSEELFENGVCLPSDTKITDEELERVCRIIKSLW